MSYSKVKVLSPSSNNNTICGRYFCTSSTIFLRSYATKNGYPEFTVGIAVLYVGLFDLLEVSVGFVDSFRERERSVVFSQNVFKIDKLMLVNHAYKYGFSVTAV